MEGNPMSGFTVLMEDFTIHFCPKQNEKETANNLIIQVNIVS